MPEEELYVLIIVGGGPAGLNAGIYVMRATLKTVLIERGVPGGQVAITKEAETCPGFIRIGGFDEYAKFLQHTKDYGLKTIVKADGCTAALASALYVEIRNDRQFFQRDGSGDE